MLETHTVPLRSIPAVSSRSNLGKPNGGETTIDTGTYLRVEISFVNGINQTNHSTNQERPCTTTQWIEKEGRHRVLHTAGGRS